MSLIGAIEAGGTKFVCAIGNGESGEIHARTSITTADNPAKTLDETASWLSAQQDRLGRFAALGIASFGPIDLNVSSPTFGRVTSTPKPGWQYTDIVGALRSRFEKLPIGFDTDVNGAALGEHRWGSARGLSDFIYITIGTGIGGGGMINGRLMHGLIHPEMGHMRLPRDPGDALPGVCPYHGDCWEGLCCGPAMKHRYGHSAEDLPAEHHGWVLETRYIATALANLTCVLSPQAIILGGSVRKGGLLGEEHFFRAVRTHVQKILNGYIASPLINDRIESYIMPPGLGDDAGIRGAMALGWSKAVIE